jgi:hypothetical protein
MDMLSAKLKAFNLTKLKAMKDYEHEHAASPKANLTLVKPVLQLDILKPNKTALKVRKSCGCVIPARARGRMER